MKPHLLFLGASDSQGVPRWWCECGICREARTTGKNARTRPSILIEAEERVLVDAAPELRMQMTRESVRGVDAAIVTHAHNDHMLGLGDVGDQARWTRRPCPIYAPTEVLPQLVGRFAYMLAPQSRYRAWAPARPLENAGRQFAGYTVTGIRVPHGFNGWAYALRFQREGASWAYMPDCLDLRDLAPWQNLDLLVLGASFYREDALKQNRSVYDVQEARELVAALRPGRVILTHLGHGVDVRKSAPEGMCYAKDGLRIELPWR
ncbi:MAG TPA: MBL fold metallo-hydrolase [Trueperaceae bacterium]